MTSSTQGEVRYVAARNGVHVAYQVQGAASRDLLLLPAEFISIDTAAEEQRYADALTALTGFSRLIRFDRGGVGLSDPVSAIEIGAIDRWVDDAISVLDAVDSSRTAVVGTNEGGLAAMLFAALHPERTAALVLFQAYARLGVAEDYGIGWPAEAVHRLVSEATAPPGEDSDPFDLLVGIAPSVAHDEVFRGWWERAGRQGASPMTARALWFAYAHADLRPALAMIQAPTLVVVRPDDAALSPAFGRFLADHITGARLVEVPGPDNLWWLDPETAFIGEVEEFLTGVRSVPTTQRSLATVLFTDIVSSTTLAWEMGDRGWRELIGRHCAESGEHVARYGGRVVKTTGDGILATFDGPGRAIRCAQAISRSAGRLGLHLRTGLHTGEVEVIGDDIAGIAVHIAARVMANASAGELLVSASIPPLVVGSGINFDDRGEHELKGVPGIWRLFAVRG